MAFDDVRIIARNQDIIRGSILKWLEIHGKSLHSAVDN